MTCSLLHELGVWEKVEAANFPIKIGATLKWGQTPELWDFNFLPNGELHSQSRPSPYEGQRMRTAFQVDRAIYDGILADHAASLGCSIHYETPVRDVVSEGDCIKALILHDGRVVRARYFLDASGHSGLIRRKMGVPVEEPAMLRNVAFWDYWRNAEWAVRLGIDGTRIQILSLDFGWLWFIQIAEDRTSVGLVCSAEHYRASGLTPEQLYTKAIQEQPQVAQLLSRAKRENSLSATKDWSFVASRMSGENWLLVGEAQGFADPILSAGITLTQAAAREAAFTILEAEHGGDMTWLRDQYEARNQRRIRQHIRFADYWYLGNGQFSDLRQYASSIALDAGPDLDGEKAFRWLASGGFVEEDMEVAGIAAIRLDQIHAIGSRLSQIPPKSILGGSNWFMLDLKGAEHFKLARYEQGRVNVVPALRRAGKVLPMNRYFAWVVEGLNRSPELDKMLHAISAMAQKKGVSFDAQFQGRILEALEAMVRDGWVKRKPSSSAKNVHHEFPHETAAVRSNRPGL